MKRIGFGKKKLVVMTEEELERIHDAGRWLYADGEAYLDMFQEFVEWKRTNPISVQNHKELIPKWKVELDNTYNGFTSLFN